MKLVIYGKNGNAKCWGALCSRSHCRVHFKVIGCFACTPNCIEREDTHSKAGGGREEGRKASLEKKEG